MFKIFVAAIALTIINCHGMPTNNINLEAITAKMMLFKMMKDNCYQNATGNEYEKFVNLTDTSMECIRDIIKQVPIFVTPVHEFKDKVQSCVEDLIAELEECLPEESKDWPQLNFDILYSFVDFAYDKKDQLMSPSFRSYVESCVQNFQQNEARDEILKCFSGYDTSSLESKVVCEAITEVENCTMTEVNRLCPGDEDIEELKSSFIAALKDPCKEYVVTVNPVDVFTLLSPYAPPNMNPELM